MRTKRSSAAFSDLPLSRFCLTHVEIHRDVRAAGATLPFDRGTSCALCQMPTRNREAVIFATDIGRQSLLSLSQPGKQLCSLECREATVRLEGLISSSNDGFGLL